MSRLGILTSHPIQYQAPLFRALAERLDLEVFFAHRQTPLQQGAAGFGTAFDWDVDLLGGYPHRFLVNRARRPGVDRFLGTDLPEIDGLVRDGRFDAFLVTGWHLRAYWQAIRACRRHDIPIMVRGDSHLGTPRGRLKQLVKEGLYRWLLHQFDGFLYVGSRNRDYLLHYDADPNRLFFSPHFVDSEWFSTRAADVDLTILRNVNDISVQEELVLAVGKMIPVKKNVDLIRAVALLRSKGSAIRTILVGNGPLEQELRTVDAKFGAGSLFVGFKNQSELPGWLALADLLVLSSQSETWGLVVNEAMACGTPVVVSDAVGCAPDLVEEGVTGTTYPMGDVAALASAIERMIGRKHCVRVQEALAAKMRTYSVATAVEGVIAAIDHLCRR